MATNCNTGVSVIFLIMPAALFRQGKPVCVKAVHCNNLNHKFQFYQEVVIVFRSLKLSSET